MSSADGDVGDYLHPDHRGRQGFPVIALAGEALTWPEAFREVGNGFVHVAAILGTVWIGWTIFKDLH